MDERNRTKVPGKLFVQARRRRRASACQNQGRCYGGRQVVGLAQCGWANGCAGLPDEEGQDDRGHDRCDTRGPPLCKTSSVIGAPADSGSNAWERMRQEVIDRDQRTPNFRRPRNLMVSCIRNSIRLSLHLRCSLWRIPTKLPEQFGSIAACRQLLTGIGKFRACLARSPAAIVTTRSLGRLSTVVDRT